MKAKHRIKILPGISVYMDHKSLLVYVCVLEKRRARMEQAWFLTEPAEHI